MNLHTSEMRRSARHWPSGPQPGTLVQTISAIGKQWWTTRRAANSRHTIADFLLSPEKRNQVVELWEVEKFGRDSFGDPDAVALYGMRPAEWYSRGVRILARTTLEAVRDPLGNRIGQDVARIAVTAPDRINSGGYRSLHRLGQRPLFDPSGTCLAGKGSASSSSPPSLQ